MLQIRKSWQGARGGRDREGEEGEATPHCKAAPLRRGAPDAARGLGLLREPSIYLTIPQGGGGGGWG